MDHEMVQFLPDPSELSGPDEAEMWRRTSWTLVTVILCAAMVLLGAGLLPLALVPSGLDTVQPAVAHSVPTPGS